MFEKTIKNLKEDWKNLKTNPAYFAHIWYMIISGLLIITSLAIFKIDMNLSLICFFGSWFYNEQSKSFEREQLYDKLGIKEFWKKVE
jgi:hypothetical protein